MFRFRPILPITLMLFACHAQPKAPVAAAPAPAPKPSLDRVERTEFNFRAQERYLPIFWRSDDNNDKKLDPEELSVLWGPWAVHRADYVDAQGFTARFYDAYRAIVAPIDDSKLVPAEKERRALVRKELRFGRPTLVETDLSNGSEEDRAIAQHVFAAAVLVEKMHARQLGVDGFVSQVPADDASSHAMFNRNQGPWCVTPQLEKVPACSALVTPQPHRSGLYPFDLQNDPKFCSTLSTQPNGKMLMDHFSTVVKGGQGYEAVAYPLSYPTESEAVAKELEALAAAIQSEAEAPLKKYALAAAQAFRSNDWEPANAAWVAMGGSTSRYYLRIAPDEVYYEPCNWKAGYAVAFARINPDSKSWQERLAPVKAEMEKVLAKLTGPPYKARDVRFRLPDFIDIILNAGDARAAHGGTIGESLPNWGPVADKGGRTVAMVNLYTDADSQGALGKQMASLFCASTNARATTNPRPAIMSTVLHEASHNLGPSHDYAVSGKKDSVVFGGPLASMLEELKAQTSALYFSEWLVDKKILARNEAEEAHVRDVAWGFGHISRGMYEADGKPKTYSQLASIQLGTLWKAGALAWHAAEPAVGGDVGCFEVDLKKWGPTVDALAARVLKIKGRGDRKDAEKLKSELVDGKDDWAKLKDVITERWLRAPKASFVYSVR